MNQIPNIKKTHNTKTWEKTVDSWRMFLDSDMIDYDRIRIDDIKDFIHHQLQQAQTEKFVDGMIAANQWLIENGHLKAGKELNEMMLKALINQSELDQDKV